MSFKVRNPGTISGTGVSLETYGTLDYMPTSRVAHSRPPIPAVAIVPAVMSVAVEPAMSVLLSMVRI
jgi:hypothetical protein